MSLQSNPSSARGLTRQSFLQPASGTLTLHQTTLKSSACSACTLKNTHYSQPCPYPIVNIFPALIVSVLVPLLADIKHNVAGNLRFCGLALRTRACFRKYSKWSWALPPCQEDFEEMQEVVETSEFDLIMKLSQDLNQTMQNLWPEYSLLGEVGALFTPHSG